MRGEETHDEEVIIRDESGEDHWVSVNASPIRDEQGRVTSGIVVFHDITERKRAEEERRGLQEQLHQAQKMEAVGELAGGVAHDFNNLLTAILGGVEQLRILLPRLAETDEALEAIEEAAQQAVGVTRSLLTFSHKLPSEKKTIDVRDVVRGSGKLLGHLLPASIDLVIHAEDDEPLSVNADPTQLQQVVLNLAINARDAMADGGVLRITLTRRTDVDDSEGDEESAREYAELSVADTGVGMSARTRARIFEPFFTTKGRGRGTGLGLSIVHGIVQEHGGWIEVESERGRGSTFKVFLPLGAEAAGAEAELPTSEIPRGSGETLVLAEDDPIVRRMIVSVLKLLDYDVIEVADGPAMADAVRRSRDRVRLIIADVDLPKRSGLDALRDLRAEGVQIPAILITGSVDTGLEARLDDASILLRKPLQLSALGRRVAQILREHRHQEHEA